ncbi:transcription factor GTE4 isoform X1 [Fagus crenata]
MASGPIVGDGARERQRYTESKVYTRKAFKGPKKNTLTTPNNNTTTTTTTTNANANENENKDKDKNSENNKNNERNGDNEKNENKNENNELALPPPQAVLASEDGNTAQKQLISRLDVGSDDSSSLNRQQEPQEVAAPVTRDEPVGNGAVKVGSENRVKINLGSRSKQEMREIRRKLENELDMVRSLVKRIEAKQGQIGGYSRSHMSAIDAVDNGGGGAKRVHSEVASVGVGVPRELNRPLHQLSISVLENSQGVSEILEKEKRTPKANQFYRNSEFLLAKDKFPPAESNKKSKSNGKKQGGGESGHGFWMGTKFYKSCSSLLEKLMKHKHGWVFNSPVDAEGLGLHDYFIIIKHPMDLGSVKSRLNKNWYKSPKEFAEDVRLTFRNAMTYNPKGQDVHVMAEQLLKVFEDRWAIIESDYNREMRYAMDYGVGLPTPTSRKAPPLPPPPLDMRRILDRSESMTNSFDPKSKPMSTTPSARTPAPKKPKAKDPHKRDMTYDEKQKLSTNLQNLPSEKLDAIVQIIKKRNSSLCQDDDEIEVDIDSVDAETLWELDRFVTNYKKSLSKHKRKAELAIQARAEAVPNVREKIQAPVVEEVPKESKTDERNVSTLSPVQPEKQVDNGSRSSSSSSSSSDSGSSSSDSDSESSSASGSDAGSPRT